MPAPAQQRILEAAARAFYRTTGLRTTIHPAPGVQNRAAAAIVELAVNHQKHRFRAEVKPVDRFATPALIYARRKAHGEPSLLVAPYISPAVAERCRQLRVPFIDTAGNAYLQARGLLVYVVGQPRPAEARQDQFRALKPAGLQIVFALACQPVLVRHTYREIAELAGVALGTVGPVLADLAKRGYLRGKHDRKLLDPERMLEEWVTHYPIKLRPKLNQRRFQAEIDRLRQADLIQLNAYWGGEPAAEKLTRNLKATQFTIYARPPITRLAAAGRMRADEAGNVEILDVFWNFAADPEFPDVVPPLLAYADLLATQDGRNVEAARMIYGRRIAPVLRSAQ